MEHLLGQQEERRVRCGAAGRSVHGWTRGVLWPGHARWKGDLRALRLVQHHILGAPFRAGILGGWWQNLGSELDYRADPDRGHSLEDTLRIAAGRIRLTSSLWY